VLHGVELLFRRGAQADVALGELRDDVLRRAALGDDPVDARVRGQVLPPSIDRDEEPDRRGERVAAEMRRERRVRGDAMELSRAS
jgi:hypothetical protein